MPRLKVITTEHIMKKAWNTLLLVEKGELTPAQGNTISSLLRNVENSIKTDNQLDNNKALERLEIIEKALLSGDTAKLQKLIEEEELGDE